jgi:hypothetical protein
MGSDAPVARLDPWLAMAAAVYRSADERAPWNPAQALTAAQALAASTDGQATVAAGNRGDVVLLEDDPPAGGRELGGRGQAPARHAGRHLGRRPSDPPADLTNRSGRSGPVPAQPESCAASLHSGPSRTSA